MPVEFRLDQRRFNRLILLAMLVGLGLLIIAFIVTTASALSNQRATNWVRHSYRVVDALDSLSLAIERVETAERGYLLSPDAIRSATRRRNAALIGPGLTRLRALTADNRRQQELIAQLSVKLADQLKTIDDMMTRAEAGDLKSARAEFTERVKVRQIDQIRDLEAAIRAEETRLLNERQAVEGGRRNQFAWILGTTGFLMLLAGIGAFWLVRRYTHDLATARDRLHRLNTDLEGVVDERTADLRRANDEIQRFAYIVSHDLRSPLVNILGFTSELEETNKSMVALLDRAKAEAPQIITPDSEAARQDLPEAIGFIRSSTQKMDRLINAILKLSREGRRTLSPERLEMVDVVKGIVDSLEHRITEIGTTVTVDKGLPALVSDRVAIEQIFSNLIENAIKYLQPGRPGEIAVRGSAKGDRIIYEIEDNGRGIDVKDHERVFDLFRRSGMQDQPGEGIGLAHVRALAYRLGGFIDLKSELGQGATFQVNLPATYADQGGRN